MFNYLLIVKMGFFEGLGKITAGVGLIAASWYLATNLSSCRTSSYRAQSSPDIQVAPMPGSKLREEDLTYVINKAIEKGALSAEEAKLAYELADRLDGKGDGVLSNDSAVQMFHNAIEQRDLHALLHQVQNIYRLRQ